MYDGDVSTDALNEHAYPHDEFTIVDEAELAKRRAEFEPLPPRYTRGVLAKYAKLVGSASRGAVCD